MEFEIRPIKEEELPAFNHNVATVFAAGPGMNVKMPPEWTLCGFEDGKLVTSYGFWPLTILFNGAPVPIAGVTMVGTYPTHRRNGYLRKVTTRHFEMMYEQGERHISALFASRTAIYQRYGYGVVSGVRSYSIEPRDVELLYPQAGDGVIREAGENDSGLLLELYHRFTDGKNGLLVREGDYYSIPGSPYATYMPPEVGAKQFKMVCYEDEKPAGYLVYGVDNERKPGQGFVQVMNLNEMVWLTPTAYHRMWLYLSRFDLVDKIMRGKAPPYDPLPHLLLEPKKLEVSAPNHGLLARIVNVEKALPLRPYSAEASLTFEVYDELCPWNRGRWQLETGPEGSEVWRTEKDPSIVMPVSTLAMLLFGRITASEAARMGRLDARDDRALPVWDKVLQTAYEPFCMDSF